MKSKEFIRILNQIVFLLEIKGENPFKIRAYSKAAEYLDEQNIDIADAVDSGAITKLEGFGKAIQEKAIEFVQTGKLSYLENLNTEVPVSLFELKRVKGLGPKKVKQLWLELGITNIDSLEDACVRNLLPELKGFTAKTQEEIFNSLSHQKAGRNKMIQDRNTQSAIDLLSLIRQQDGVNGAEFTGEMRQFSEVISQIEIMVNSEYSDALSGAAIPEAIRKVESSGAKLDIRVCRSDNYIWELHRSSSSQEYLAAFNNYVEAVAYNYRPDGLYKDGKLVIVDSEEELYAKIDLQFVPPELREFAFAIDRAKTNSIPMLIEDRDMKGMMHIHTDWSDGQNSMLEMALRSKELGFEYLAVCDHSAYAAYANGLDYARVHSQFAEIDRLNAQGLGITLLRGIESDILPDGSLDYTPEILSEFDIVVASIHSNFQMNKTEMTKRIIKAVQNPYSTIIGHPTGRLLLTRAGYEIDIDEFIQACADNNKVIEINANPYRLDFNWINAYKAKEKGVKLAINPDSHKSETLSDISIGVRSARKAWLSKEDVVNCLPCDDFIKTYIKRNR